MSNTTETPTVDTVQTPDANTTDASNVTYTATDVAPRRSMTRLKRGRHPAVTKGAFGNGRKHNGIKFRDSKLISRIR